MAIDQIDIEAGSLVEVYFPDVPNEHAIYMGPDYSSPWWRSGSHPGNHSRVLVFWDGGVTSVPFEQIEVIHESR